ncbi:hypothetical protein NDU88_005518, partial [Pleurodeles waltl]
ENHLAQQITTHTRKSWQGNNNHRGQHTHSQYVTCRNNNTAFTSPQVTQPMSLAK